MYYLYKHTRLDTGEVFYVGIGVKKNYKTNCNSIYARAYSKHHRSKYWNNIVNKTGYIIEIIYECNTEKEIKNKEIEYICLYGRLDLKKGTLVNMTDGGDGNLNPVVHSKGMLGKKHTQETVNKIIESNKKRIYSEETKLKISNSLKGRKRSQEIKDKISNTLKGHPNWNIKKELINV